MSTFHPSTRPLPLRTASDSHLASGEGGESGGDSSGGGGITLRGRALGCETRTSECLTRRWLGDALGGLDGWRAASCLLTLAKQMAVDSSDRLPCWKVVFTVFVLHCGSRRQHTHTQACSNISIYVALAFTFPSVLFPNPHAVNHTVGFLLCPLQTNYLFIYYHVFLFF